MKRTFIKIWPELINYQPAILPFDKVSDQKENSVHLDFNNCTKADSAGVNLLLIDLLKLFKKSYKRNWSIDIPDTSIKDFLKQCGFISIISNYSGEYELSIDNTFDETLLKSSTLNLTNEFRVEDSISFPIYYIDFSSYQERRDAMEIVRKIVSTRIKEIFVEFDLKPHFFLAIIQELIKNSADHTSENAFLGMDISINSQRTLLKMQFSYGDLGHGIHDSIKTFIKDNDPSFANRVANMALSDSYHYALKTGFTTKQKSTRNKGMGMTLILEASNALNLNLSVFDANSRAVLSKLVENSHSEIRKVLYDTGRKVGFYYYGELTKIK
jgi:ABC-type transporter Mla MlaB component